MFGMTEQGMDRNNSRVLPQLGDGKDVVFESEASEGEGGAGCRSSPLSSHVVLSL